VHGYLSVSITGFDEDRFRHVGSEYRLIEHLGESNPLTRSSRWDKTISLGPVAVPSPIANLAQFSYSFQWTLVALIADTLTVNAYLVDLYLGWLIWACFVPILFYTGGRLLFKSNSPVPLLLAQLSLVPYLLIYNGGQTLPVAFGAIFFLLFVTLCLGAIEDGDKKKKYLLAMLAGLSFFSYTLSFIAVVVAWVFLAIRSDSLKDKRAWLAIFGLSALLVLVEGLSTYSYFILPVIAKIYRQLFNLNIIFFAGDYFYKFNHFWLSGCWKILTLVSYTGFGYLVFRLAVAYKNNRQFVFLLALPGFLLLSFLFGITFLDGVLATIKRLNVFLALIAVMLFGFGLVYFETLVQKYKTLAVVSLTLIFSLSFVSGPFTIFASSVDDVLVGKYLSQQIGTNWNNYCVLSDIFVLLPLEAFTDREIAGGNFPLTTNHGQPELNSLMQRIKQQANRGLLDEIFTVTGKQKCYIILDGDTNQTVVNQLTILTGNHQSVYNKHLWLINK
jgi:hypothetical protein